MQAKSAPHPQGHMRFPCRAGGPAGPQFEARVATHYALGLLAQTEAFGLPGAVIDRLEFQRGGQGHPLDDIIIKATTRSGEQRCLEVQAKRSMAFTEADSNFAAVVAAIVEPDYPYKSAFLHDRLIGHV